MLDIAARVRNLSEAESCIGFKFGKLEITVPCPAEESAWLELAARYGLRYLGHAPQEGDPRDVGRLEAEYLPGLFEAVTAAARLNIELLTVHMWLEHRALAAETVEAKIGLLARIAEYGRSAGVTVCLENLSEGPEDLGRAFRKVPDLGLTLDVGHAQLLTERNKSVNIMESLFDRLRHVHVHDNRGGDNPKADLHLPPGQGLVPFEEILRALKARGYGGAVTLELKPPELCAARDYLTEIWNRV